jgi:uncharacterized protein (TIGR03067 family)
MGRSHAVRNRLDLALVVGLAAGASLGGDSPPRRRRDAAAARVKDEVARLQGDWVLVDLEVDGRRADAEQLRTWFLVIEKDRYNPGSGVESLEYTFRVDPARLPKAIDLVPADGPFERRVFRAAYALEGDRLTVCRPLDPGADRPAGLQPRRGSGISRSIWKRRTDP